MQIKTSKTPQTNELQAAIDAAHAQGGGLITRLTEDLVVENLRSIPAGGDPRPLREDL